MDDENKIYLTVISYIKDGLRNGSLQAGGKLPTEREMAETLKISRNSVREALRTLDNMGILECRQGSGNYLQGRIGRGLAEALSMHIMMDVIKTSDVLQVKRSIDAESFIAILSQDLDCDLEEMEHQLKRMDASADTEVEADVKFHDCMVGCNGNPLFQCLSAAVADAYGESIYFSLKGLKRQQINQCHHEILRALKLKDYELGLKAISRHYQIVEDALSEGHSMQYAENVS